jgi:hypothetical protein
MKRKLNRPIQPDDPVPLAWSDDGQTRLTVAAWGNRHFRKGTMIGARDTFREASELVMNNAVAHFKNKQDQEALTLRRIANELEALAVEKEKELKRC